jgi:hypothetical protein
MALTAAPYGLRPVRLLNGSPCSGQTNLYRIESGEADVFYFGQPVQYSSGYIVNCSAGDLGTTSTPDEFIGVFMGCSYTDPNTGYKIWKQYYPGSVTASDIEAYIADDPNIVYQIQANSTAYNALANIGKCYALNGVTAGSAATGNSSIALDTDGTPAAGNTLPFKVVGLPTPPDNINAATGQYTDVLVTISRPFHILASNNG